MSHARSLANSTTQHSSQYSRVLCRCKSSFQVTESSLTTNVYKSTPGAVVHMSLRIFRSCDTKLPPNVREREDAKKSMHIGYHRLRYSHISTVFGLLWTTVVYGGYSRSSRANRKSNQHHLPLRLPLPVPRPSSRRTRKMCTTRSRDSLSCGRGGSKTMKGDHWHVHALAIDAR